MKSQNVTSNLYFACLYVWVSVSLYPINKRQNGWFDQIFFGTSRDPREGFWMIKICLHQNSIFKNKIREVLFVFVNNVHKENMFTMEMEDGREAP